MPGGRLTLLLFVFAVAVAAWARAVEPSIGLPVWGSRTWGIGLVFCGGVLVLWGAISRELARWFPRPIATGIALTSFGVSMAAGSRAGLWLLSPVVALTAGALALAGFGKKHHWLASDDDSPPTLNERVRFWFCCAVPWIAIYEFTVHMRLPGYPFQFAFEDQLPIYPVTSLIYQSTYAAVTAAPFLARTRRDLRRLTISGWVATVVVFPFYWLVPSAAPRRPMEVTGLLGRLLDFERNTYPPSAAFPSFHVLWSIFIGRVVRPQWIGWAYALAVSVTCITTGMHYIPDVLASFILAPLFMEPERFLWRPMRRTGLSAESLTVALVYALLVLVLFCLWWRSAAPAITLGIAAIGIFLTEFTRRTRRGQWDANRL